MNRVEVIALSKEGRGEEKKVSFFFEVTLLLRSLSLSLLPSFFSPPHERTNEKLSCMIKGCGKERKKKKKAKKASGERKKKRPKRTGRKRRK